MKPLFLCSTLVREKKKQNKTLFYFHVKERKKFWKLLIAILLSQGDLLPINGANTKEVDLRRREKEGKGREEREGKEREEKRRGEGRGGKRRD